MTDRQIEVLERLQLSIKSMFDICGVYYNPLREELDLIIKEQKEINHAEFKSKAKG